MVLSGVGKVLDAGAYWQLIYDRCGHTQVFARLGLEWPEQAEREVRRWYATCLTCQAAARLADRPRLNRTLRLARELGLDPHAFLRDLQAS